LTRAESFVYFERNARYIQYIHFDVVGTS